MLHKLLCKSVLGHREAILSACPARCCTSCCARASWGTEKPSSLIEEFVVFRGSCRLFFLLVLVRLCLLFLLCIYFLFDGTLFFQFLLLACDKEVDECSLGVIRIIGLLQGVLIDTNASRKLSQGSF